MKTTNILQRLSCIAVVLSGLTMASTASAEQSVAAQFSMPMQVNGRVTATDCNNSPGPVITLEGEIVLGGVQARLIFQNNVKGTHTATVTYGTNIVLIPLGSAITLPKQPVRGGVGGNPHIWIQLHDGAGQNLTDEIYLGRCVQGLQISPAILGDVLAQADLLPVDCLNHPGPTIQVGGSLTFESGVHARFIFRNNLRGTHTATVTREVELIGAGTVVSIPKQPVLGGAGGNPIISVQFLSGSGDPIGRPVRLGRCNQL